MLLLLGVGVGGGGGAAAAAAMLEFEDDDDAAVFKASLTAYGSRWRHNTQSIIRRGVVDGWVNLRGDWCGRGEKIWH